MNLFLMFKLRPNSKLFVSFDYIKELSKHMMDFEIQQILSCVLLFIINFAHINLEDFSEMIVYRFFDLKHYLGKENFKYFIKAFYLE